MTPLILSLALLAQQPTAPERIKSLSGDIEALPEFHSKALGNARPIWVYKPPTYATEPNRRFPVLYMLDGQNIFDGSTSFIPNGEWRMDETAEMLIGAGLMEPVIIVGIANAGMERANEYLPITLQLGGKPTGGKANASLDFIANELKPWIDKRFRTKTDAANTGLGGSSFGAVLTLHAGLTKPNVFGKLLAMSPSLWIDNGHFNRAYAKPASRPAVRLWVDMGAQEGPQVVNLFNDFTKVLERKGWRKNRDFRAVVEPRGEHNEFAWARRMPLALTYLFPPR